MITALRELCRGRTAGKIRTHLNYFLKNRHRFAYTTMVGLGLPRGSGAVESAIRRVINLRIKGASKEQAVRVMLEKYEVCCGLFHGFDRTAWTTGSPADRLNLLPAALEHVLAQDDGKTRCLKTVRELSQAFALAVPHPETVRIRDDVSLFQHVRAALSKRTGPGAKSDEELDHAVRQIVSRAVASGGVVDIFAAAGLKKPDVSVLSEDFLREVRGMRRRNLAVELLEKLLKGELATRRRKNVVQARSFAEMLEQTIRRYQNRAVEAAQVIEELIGLAREMREANARGEALGLSDDEMAFYDALGVNDSAVLLPSARN